MFLSTLYTHIKYHSASKCRLRIFFLLFELIDFDVTYNLDFCDNVINTCNSKHRYLLFVMERHTRAFSLVVTIQSNILEQGTCQQCAQRARSILFRTQTPTLTIEKFTAVQTISQHSNAEEYNTVISVHCPLLSSMIHRCDQHSNFNVALDKLAGLRTPIQHISTGHEAISDSQ